MKINWHWPFHFQDDRVQPIETDRDMNGAFAIADDNSLWLATHQAINELEKEVIETARKCSANPSLSNYHLGASEGVTMVRLRLIEKRKMALKATEDLLKAG
jgi:hypothetical protein